MHGEDPDEWRPTSAQRVARIEGWNPARSARALVQFTEPGKRSPVTRVWANDFCQLHELAMDLVFDRSKDHPGVVAVSLVDWRPAFRRLFGSREQRCAFAMCCDTWQMLQDIKAGMSNRMHKVSLPDNPAWNWLRAHYPR